MRIARRDFLKSIGIVGASSLGPGSLLSCDNQAPRRRLYAYLDPLNGVVPGVAAYYATVCRGCPAGCGLMVKTREGRPIKLEGNPDHPVNRGRLCARGQAFIQGLYSAHRVRTAYVRKRNQLRKVSLGEAIATTAERMKGARSVGFLTGLESGSCEDLLDDFISRFPGSQRVAYDPLSPGSLMAASDILFGKREVPTIHLTARDKRPGVDRLFSFGADLLDGWLSPVQLSRQWAEQHAIGSGRRMRMEYLGPRRNLTATAADRWHRVNPRQVGSVVLAILHELFQRKKGRSLPQAREVEAIISKLPRPGNLGALQDTVVHVARELDQAKVGLVLFGGAEVLTSEATRIQCAAMLINWLTGSVGTALQYGSGYVLSKADTHRKALDLLEQASTRKVDILFVSGCNPVYTLPDTGATIEKLKNTKFVVSLAHEHDETTGYAHVVLPVHHPLESWGDYAVSRDINGLMQPVRPPLYDTRHAGDLLIDLLRTAGQRPTHKDYKRYVVARWLRDQRFGMKLEADQNVDAWLREHPGWERTLIRGGEFVNQPAETQTVQLSTAALDRLEALKPEESGSGPVLVAPVSNALYDGRSASANWLLELAEPLLQTSWEIPIELPPAIANRHSISQGDLVEVTGPSGRTVRAAAAINEDLDSNTVALRQGGGRFVSGESIRSGNVVELLSGVTDPESGAIAWVQTVRSIRRVAGGKLASVTGGTSSQGRLLCLAMSEKNHAAGRFPVMTRHGEVYPDASGKVKGRIVPMPHQEVGGTRPHDNMVELPRHPEHRWGMVVDLDRCTGCSACVVACYAENNIPVVGRDEVTRGRELAWIRIEKHVFRNSRGGRTVRFLPMLCQHCGNAPCESVCPVFAPYHTPDGLNAQIYNRCVGTRYCSNNCPYKVRRFNFFDYKREHPAHQQLNPDVVVRSRGVMEKCTFCIQRIRELTNRAKVEGRAVQEKEVAALPACVQTCPTGALTFGDFKQPQWKMARMARDPRGYRVLDYITNTRPGVVYLRKVYTHEEDA